MGPVILKPLSEKLTQFIEYKSLTIFIQDHLSVFTKIFPDYKVLHQDDFDNHIEQTPEKNLFISELNFRGMNFKLYFICKQDTENQKHIHCLESTEKQVSFISEFIFQNLKNEINESLLKLKCNDSEEDIFELMFLKAHNAMAFATPDGYISHANEAWAKMHMMDKKEIIGKHLSIFHTQEQFENEVITSIEKAIKHGLDTREVGHVDSKGNIIPTLMTIIKLVNSKNEFLGLAGIATDVSEQQNLVTRLITILENVAFGIVIIDPENFKIIELNTAAQKYIALPKNQIIGRSCTHFICTAKNGKCPHMHLHQVIHNSEKILINGQGERIPILKTVKDVTLGGRKVIIESFIDIRDQKKAQLEAEESAKLKTAFLSNISHELRTPLNHILGFTSLVLDDDKIEDTYKEYLGIVKRSGNNLLRIIEDIVTISKIEAGHHVVNEHEFDLKQSIYKIYTKYQSENVRKAKDIKILFENKLGIDKFFIKADEMKIIQVTENLISNAIKYTEKGSVIIKLVADKTNAQIIVSDTGKGIKKENLNYIFESFRQVETSDRKIYDGTGIGLTICKSLSNMIGGNIEVESEPGVGSTFTFSFPFNTSENIGQSELPDDISVPDLTGKSIMVVEDEKINFLYIKTLLTPTQAHVIWKLNGREALEYFEKSASVDLVLMDMQMPVMNGYIATEEIRKINQKVPIIALTANVLADDRKKCLSLGCNEYTTKPIQQDVLFWHLHQFIK